MAKVICSHCGATGHSKNPACRTVFPDDQNDAVLSHLLKFPVIKDGVAEGNIRFVADTKEEYFRNLVSCVKMLEKVGIEKYCCDHDWELAPGAVAEVDF